MIASRSRPERRVVAFAREVVMRYVVPGSLMVVLVLAPSGVARAADEDCHHAHPVAMKRATRSTTEVAVPEVELVREDGKTVSLARELDDGRPVVLNFIFTTCASICPVMSQTFAQLQAKLGGQGARVHMVSISIDPEQDTPVASGHVRQAVPCRRAVALLHRDRGGQRRRPARVQVLPR